MVDLKADADTEEKEMDEAPATPLPTSAATATWRPATKTTSLPTPAKDATVPPLAAMKTAFSMCEASASISVHRAVNFTNVVRR